jgi:hypothetical protein
MQPPVGRNLNSLFNRHILSPAICSRIPQTAGGSKAAKEAGKKPEKKMKAGKS